MTPDEQALKDKLVKIYTEHLEECMAEDANPYLLLMKLESEVKWLRHETIVAGKK